MKNIIMFGASLAAFALGSGAHAREAQSVTSGGHYEWRARSGLGANKMPLPAIRIWVKDTAGAMAGCDCAMMREKMAAKECMAAPRKGEATSRS